MKMTPFIDRGMSSWVNIQHIRASVSPVPDDTMATSWRSLRTSRLTGSTVDAINLEQEGTEAGIEIEIISGVEEAFEAAHEEFFRVVEDNNFSRSATDVNK